MTRYSPNHTLDCNEKGLEIIRRSESFRPEWYKCPAGVWTIGYGTTENSLPGVNRSLIRHPIDKAQAERWLQESIAAQYEPVVERRVRVELSSNMFSALVSLVYNIGSAFTNSTLLRKLNTGDYDGAADEFARWIYADGRVLPGLVKRRKAEQMLFETMDRALVPVPDLEPMKPLGLVIMAGKPVPDTLEPLPPLT